MAEDLEELRETLRQKEEFEFKPHFYHRARRRNIDAEFVKDKLEKGDVDDFRPNNQSDASFDQSYKVRVRKSRQYSYEIPIYFNEGGKRVVVKSVWKTG